MLKFNIRLHFDYSIHIKNCLMSEKITSVKLKENISKKDFFLDPGVGTFELKSLNMAGHLTSDLVPGVGNLTIDDFKSSNARGILKLQIIDTLCDISSKRTIFCM